MRDCMEGRDEGGAVSDTSSSVEISLDDMVAKSLCSLALAVLDLWIYNLYNLSAPHRDYL